VRRWLLLCIGYGGGREKPETTSRYDNTSCATGTVPTTHCDHLQAALAQEYQERERDVMRNQRTRSETGRWRKAGFQQPLAGLSDGRGSLSQATTMRARSAARAARRFASWSPSTRAGCSSARRGVSPKVASDLRGHPAVARRVRRSATESAGCSTPLAPGGAAGTAGSICSARQAATAGGWSAHWFGWGVDPPCCPRVLGYNATVR